MFLELLDIVGRQRFASAVFDSALDALCINSVRSIKLDVIPFLRGLGEFAKYLSRRL